MADHSAAALFNAVISKVIKKLIKFNPQNLDNIVLVCATVQYPVTELFDTVAVALTVTATTNSTAISKSKNRLDTFKS